LSEIWKIPPPQWSYTDDTVIKVFELRWDINDIIESSQMDFQFYDADCQGGGGSVIQESDTGYQITTEVPTSPTGTGTGTRQFIMRVQTQVPDISSNVNPKIYDPLTDTFQICVRVGLSTPSSQFSEEVNWSESLIRVQYDLTDGFATSNADVVPPQGT
jgi:hypothetical protein